METGWRNTYSGGDGSGTGGRHDSGGVGQDAWGNNTCDIKSTNFTPPPAVTCYHWSHPAATATASASVSNSNSARVPEASVIHALLFGDARAVGSSTSLHHRMPDPHMICLKLGKRHYCEDAVVPDRHVTPESSSLTKRGKQQYSYGDVTDTTTNAPGVRITSSPSAAAVARCQVEGCHVGLANAKEYYRRHKVCEIHSKSPKVLVLGLQQRFCQQCSRFHGVTEFDEAKRSCRRRLEGHNLRRRKGTLSHSLPQNFPHSHENNCMTKPRHPTLPPPQPPLSKPGCALSLLSSPKTEPWISSDDLSSRCSAALYELIVANRATSVVGRPLSHHQSGAKEAMHPLPEAQMWDGFGNNNETTMKLDLMSMKEKSKSPEEWTDYCWSGFGGSNVA